MRETGGRASAEGGGGGVLEGGTHFLFISFLSRITYVIQSGGFN